MDPVSRGGTSRFLGLTLYWEVGFFTSYLLFDPIVQSSFGSDPLRALIAWGIAIGGLVAWGLVFRKESRVRSSGRVPPFSGNTPRLALTVLLFGAILGPIIAVVYG